MAHEIGLKTAWIHSYDSEHFKSKTLVLWIFVISGLGGIAKMIMASQFVHYLSTHPSMLSIQESDSSRISARSSSVTSTLLTPFDIWNKMKVPKKKDWHLPSHCRLSTSSDFWQGIQLLPDQFPRSCTDRQWVSSTTLRLHLAMPGTRDAGRWWRCRTLYRWGCQSWLHYRYFSPQNHRQSLESPRRLRSRGRYRGDTTNSFLTLHTLRMHIEGWGSSANLRKRQYLPRSTIRKIIAL